MRVALAVAMGRNHVIGTAAGLPWHLPRDLKHFRAVTLGKPIVMGRTTFDHIGRPLPGRTTIVLTRRADYAPDGVRVVRSVAEALAEARGAEEVVVVGGGEVYRAFLPLVERVYLTVVDGDFDGTTTFPVAALAELPLAVTGCERHPADERNAFALTFWQLDRRDGGAVGVRGAGFA